MKNLTDEDFETNRGAVNTQIQQKDVNLQQVASRMFGYISTHSYRFNLQNEKIEALKEVTKAQVQALFERVFFSDQTKRVDLTLTSETHKDDNAEFRSANSQSDAFRGMNRTVHAGSHGAFKKQMMLYPDAIKNSFQKFIDGTHKY